MARYSGSAEGGAAAVQTVNGVAPIAGDVTLPAAAIPSTGPSDVQADLDLLGGSVATGLPAVESWAEFIALPGVVEGPAGVWTFNQPIKAQGVFLGPAGERVVGGVTSSLSASGVNGGTWIFDVDGPGFTGPILMQNQAVQQTNLGASARCWDLTSAGRFVVFSVCSFIGGAEGIRIGPVTGGGSAISYNSACIAQPTGVRVQGQIDGLSMTNFGGNSPIPGFVLVNIDTTATFAATSGALFTSPQSILTAGQFVFAIAHAATLTSPALIQVSGASNLGPQANMFRQTAPGVTDMDIDDNRLVITGGPSVANWQASGIASRFDTADPLIVDNSAVAGGTPVVIPYEDGAGNLEIVASIEAHFTLFKNGADPLDWYFEYTGPRSDATIRLTSDILADRASAGPSEAILCWEKSAAPGHISWVMVPDSGVPWENTNSIIPRSGTAVAKGVNTGDRFRPAISDSSATDVRLGEIKIDLAISS